VISVNRVRAFLVLLVLVGLAFASGCQSEEHRADGVEAVVRLSYWSAPNPEEYALARYMVERWNDENPHIQVTVQPIPAGQSSEEILLAAVAAGTTPDICSNIWPGITQDFIRAGGLLRLDRFGDFDSLMQARVPADLLASFRAADGHFYQIPWKTNPIMMQYNVRLFREAGIEDPPRTYSEYLAAAEKIAALPGLPRRWMGFRDIRPIWWQRYFDYYTFYIAASGGGMLFTDGELDIDEQASNQVFAFFGEIWERKFYPLTSEQGTNPFVAERMATEFTGPWNVAWLEQIAPHLEFDYAPIPVPDAYEGPVYTYGDHKNIAIFSTTKHPEAAWQFARYLVSREADLLLLERARQLPVRKDMLGDSLFADFFARHPRMTIFAEQAPFTRGVDGVSDLKEILDALARQFEAASVYRVRTPEEATRRAVARIQVIRKWNS
jgi:multiple sugar transport system substrate-binding protein